MIEVISHCHRLARMLAVERNSGRPVFLVSCFRREASDQIRFVFRTTSSGGCS